ARAGAFEAFEPGRRRAAWEALRVAGDLLPLAPARVLPFEPRELEGPGMSFLDYLAPGVSTNGHPMEHLRARLRAAGGWSCRALGPPGRLGGVARGRGRAAAAAGTGAALRAARAGRAGDDLPRLPRHGDQHERPSHGAPARAAARCGRLLERGAGRRAGRRAR